MPGETAGIPDSDRGGGDALYGAGDRGRKGSARSLARDAKPRLTLVGGKGAELARRPEVNLFLHDISGRQRLSAASHREGEEDGRGAMQENAGA
ncbi:MAG: hypothetical protein KA967_06430 [Methanoculleus sp.]|nr:hypothetical protein [Methanoculleus sp.]